MNPVEAWKTVVIERYVKFDGRSARPEFWWFALANFIVFTILGLLAGAASALYVVVVLYYLAILLPSLAVAIRRLHDSDKSGWWILIGLIPFGGIVLLVFFCLAGTPGPNKFGPVPE